MPKSLPDPEIALIIHDLLAECHGSRPKAATLVGIDRTTFWRCEQRKGSATPSIRAKFIAFAAARTASGLSGKSATPNNIMQQSATIQKADIAAAKRMLHNLMVALEALEQAQGATT